MNRYAGIRVYTPCQCKTTMHSKSFDKLVTAARTISTQAPDTQVLNIREKLLPALKTRIDKNTGKAKLLYQRAFNACASLADGIKSGDVSKKDLKGFIETTEKLRQEAVVIEQALEKKKKKEEATKPGWKFETVDIDEPEDFTNTPPSKPDRPDSVEFFNSMRDEGRKTMQKYSSFENMVPLNINKKFKAVRVPLVVVTDGILLRERLKALKLSDDDIFNYPVIKNQLVVGIDMHWLNEKFKGKPDEAIAMVLDSLHEQTNKRFHQLGGPHTRGQVKWIWLATPTDIAKFNKASAGGRFKLQNWHFPFSPEVFKRK